MPKCYACQEPTPGPELGPFGKNNRGWPEDELGCPSCRRKRLTHLVSVPKGKEVAVSERKPIASVQVFPSIDEDNYEIKGYVRLGGMKLEFDTDMDKIRGFFTKRRERNIKDKRIRKAVDKANAEIVGN
jgi:hypothetical protein